MEVDNLILNKTLAERNDLWNKCPHIPKWVDPKNVGLDQFFTKPEIAKKCYKSLIDFLRKKNINFDDYTFIEPSAGAGSFFNLLPVDKRLGIDMYPMSSDIIKADFLTWQPKKANKLIAVGNPPFGYRAWLALAFMNKVSEISDYVGFILPMSFQSEGKGSSKYRVNGMKLVHSEVLPQDSFTDPFGKTLKVNALWQIWEKGENIKPKMPDLKSYIDLFTVDLREERLCGQEKMSFADIFIQRTFYKEPPSPVASFSDVKYVCGYGLIIKRNKNEIIKALNETDWFKYSNLAAHNCRHISMHHIQNAIIDKGIICNV